MTLEQVIGNDVDCLSSTKGLFLSLSGRRKSSTSSVTLKDCGSGRVIINGQDYLHYFPILQDR